MSDRPREVGELPAGLTKVERKKWVCSAMLPPPGDDVARRLLATTGALRMILADLVRTGGEAHSWLLGELRQDEAAGDAREAGSFGAALKNLIDRLGFDLAASERALADPAAECTTCVAGKAARDNDEIRGLRSKLTMCKEAFDNIYNWGMDARSFRLMDEAREAIAGVSVDGEAETAQREHLRVRAYKVRVCAERIETVASRLTTGNVAHQQAQLRQIRAELLAGAELISPARHQVTPDREDVK